MKDDLDNLFSLSLLDEYKHKEQIKEEVTEIIQILSKQIKEAKLDKEVSDTSFEMETQKLNVTKEDETKKCDSREEILANVKEKKDGYINVKKII